MKDRTRYTDAQWNAIWARVDRKRDLPRRQMVKAWDDLKMALLEPLVPVVEWLNRRLGG